LRSRPREVSANQAFRSRLINFCWCAGLEGICNKLKVDLKMGLSGKDFAARTE